MTVREEDLARIIDYLDGRLTPEEMVGFEVRLTRESELAAALERFERVDRAGRFAQEGQRADGEGQAARPSPASRGWALAGLAAAALALFLGRVGLWQDAELEWAVAALPSGPSPFEYHAELGLVGEEARTIWRGYARSGADPEDMSEVSPDEYHALVAPMEAERVARAISGSSAAVSAEYFTLPLRTTTRGSIVVLLIDARGDAVGVEGQVGEIAFPPAGWRTESGRFEPGDHVLPRENVQLLDGGVSYAPGFLVPRGAERLEVVVGFAREPLGPALEAELRVRLGEGERDATALAGWLRERGLETRTLFVDERR